MCLEFVYGKLNGDCSREVPIDAIYDIKHILSVVPEDNTEPIIYVHS